MSKKQYDIFGIGNALVDLEIQLSESELADAGIEKGVVELIDDAKRSDLLTAFEPKIRSRACGGSAANTVIGAIQLGCTGFYACKVANDELGQFYAQDLQENGTDSLLGSTNLPDGKTGTCFVFVTPDADRSMCSFLGITETVSIKDIDLNALKQSQYLYIEGYLAPSPSGKEAAIQAKKIAEEHGVLTAITLSDPNMVKFFKSSFDEMIGSKIDLIFCNEAEAQEFCGSSDENEIVTTFKSLCKAFAITKGKEGALLYDGQSLITVTSPEVNAVDTTGAGDLFAGTFLAGLCQGMDFKTAGEKACYAAAQVIQTYGPRLTPDSIQTTQRFFKT
tara:strand:+ start:684 stop:1685 length:1002 start_codon:yes stop_codon:yes gene_type:complete